MVCIEHLLNANEHCRVCIATNEMHASCASMNNNEQYDSPKKFLGL